MKSSNRFQSLSMFGLLALLPLLCLNLTKTRALSLPSTVSYGSLKRYQVNLRKPTSLNFFFGNQNDGDTNDRENKQLVFFPKLATQNADVKYDSLTNFVGTWSKKFEEGGLTTPVKVVPLPQEELEDGVEGLGGVRIIFKPKKSSYKSKEEEDTAREGTGESKKKKEPPKEGGVEIRVEKLAKGEVQLLAKRCEVDEDTMIKEMSEETIVAELKKAIDAWKKQ